VLVGFSLGFVYAPCAGPILAGVITVSASQSLTAARLAVALAYGIGAALALYAVMRGGRRLTRRLSPHAGRLQAATGAVMVLVALLMLGGYDTRFQTAIAADLPSVLVNPTKSLEESASARERLAALRGAGGRALPVLARAPDFVGTQRWFNTPGGRPLSLARLRGKVVLVDFWTYTCINCIRTLPVLKAWDARYRRAGLVIVGVHTPEFPFERSAGNVERAIAQNHLRYPVVQDNRYGTWQAYRNVAWPAEYFIDARGRLRYVHVGEGDEAHKEAVIRALLAEAGRPPGAPAADARGDRAAAGLTTPESYLGAARAERFVPPVVAGTRTYSSPPLRLPADHLAYGGTWRIGGAAATAVRRASLRLDFGARRVYLVLGSRGGAPRSVRVRLDGRPITARAAGADVRDGRVRVVRQRLYSLVALPRVERHLLSLDFDSGVSAYAFTFG
jgi:thiol-disulfide isomerase/thioredoxin